MPRVIHQRDQELFISEVVCCEVATWTLGSICRGQAGCTAPDKHPDHTHHDPWQTGNLASLSRPRQLCPSTTCQEMLTVSQSRLSSRRKRLVDYLLSKPYSRPPSLVGSKPVRFLAASAMVCKSEGDLNQTSPTKTNAELTLARLRAISGGNCTDTEKKELKKLSLIGATTNYSFALSMMIPQMIVLKNRAPKRVKDNCLY